MTLNQSALLEFSEVLRGADGGEMMRLMLATMLQALVDAEATARIGASRHERTDARITQRNGTREKVVSTTSGDLTVKIAKTRTGVVLPVAAGSASADRCGVARGGDGGLCAWGVHPQGR